MSKYGVRRPAPPPPNLPSQTQLTQYFNRVDRNKSGTITGEELQAALSNGNDTKFNMCTVNMMIGMFDHKKTGEINLEQFGSLWRYIVDWQNCFKTFDSDKSGSINVGELRGALEGFGYTLSAPVIQMLLNKFDRTRQEAIKLDDFIQCCLVLHSVTDAFRQEDTDLDGVIQISYEKFLTMIFQSNLF